METPVYKLPIGIQTFEKIREGEYVYVDKTRYLVNLIENGQVYFLARPRRFGKSLTVSTLEALFSGKKDLFNGLYAEAYLNRPEFEPSPVLRLDMSQITTGSGMDVFKQSLEFFTRKIAGAKEIELSGNLSYGDLFNQLIEKTYQKYNAKVVVLIDEYDKPYTDFINDIDTANRVREILRNYYIQIKANDGYIRFVFLTGISKFAKFGVFSTLNTPLDISMMEKYAALCGYTEDELLQYFPVHLDSTAKKFNIAKDKLLGRLRNYYDGFSFDGKTCLYNPYSTLSFFETQDFYNFWIDTGKPKVIAEYMKGRNLTVEQFRNFPISKDFAKNPGEMDTARPEGYLYQGGYLTLREGTIDDFALDYPNTEVLNAMSALVSQNILRDRNEDYTRCRTSLLSAIMGENVRDMINVFNRLLASIPYDDFVNAAQQNLSDNNYKFPVQEWLYRSTILAFLRGCGVAAVAEMHTNLGRADMVVSHKGNVWVLELKVAYDGEDPAEKANEALRQIIEKNYAKPYPNAKCIGLAIDNNQRQITEIRT
jgi:hypothetical protein